MLVEILTGRVSLPVVWARPGEPLAAGVVSVCPRAPRSRFCPIGNGRRCGADGPLPVPRSEVTAIRETFGEGVASPSWRTE